MVIPIGGKNAFPDDGPNAWSITVTELCTPILEELPEYLRVDAASALYTESRADSNIDIPWTVVFNDDTPEIAAAHLLSTCLTPDKKTPSHNPELRTTIDALSSLIRSKSIERGPETMAIARRLIQFAAEKPDTPFKIYADDARRTPMRYGWKGRLEQQFGEASYDILTAEPKLGSIVAYTEFLTASIYDEVELAYQVHPDSDSTFIHGFLPDDDRYGAYALAVYQLRGLSP